MMQNMLEGVKRLSPIGGQQVLVAAVAWLLSLA